MKFTNNKHGFTLIEVVVALALIVLLGGFVITSMTAIPQARMREMSQTLKSEFETTRNFAKTHGGEASISIKKVDGGIMLIREGKNLTTQETLLSDKELQIFYKETDDEELYQLGVNDASDVDDATLMMTFSQTNGAIIGQHMLDYIIMSNGSKNYKLILQHASGMMYYDYELDEDMYQDNVLNDETVVIRIPQFIQGGAHVETVELEYTGTAIQPEINYDSRYIKIGGVYRAVLDGTYTITFTLKDPYSTQWSDGTTSPKTLVWKIK